MKHNKNQIREQIEMHERVDEILERAVDQDQQSAPDVDEYGWQRVLLNVVLMGAFLALSAGIILWDLGTTLGLHNNPGGQLAVRAVGIGILAIGYLRMRQLLHEALFPRVDREVIKTVYKIAPELIRDGHTAEAADINLNKNALRTWVLVFGVMIALTLMVLGNPAFLDSAMGIVQENSVGGTVVRVILVAFGLGVWSSIQLMLVVHREYDHLGEVVWRIQHLGHQINAAEALRKALPSQRDSIIAEKLRAIIRIWQMKGTIVPADLREHAFSHFRLNRQVPHFIAAAMPILGLVGTILGLTVSIGGFEDVLSTTITDRAQFAANIGTSVGGISTAFYTTLAGTIGMLVLKIFTLISSNVYANFLVDMRNVLAVEVLPRLREHGGPQKPARPVWPEPINPS